MPNSAIITIIANCPKCRKYTLLSDNYYGGDIGVMLVGSLLDDRGWVKVPDTEDYICPECVKLNRLKEDAIDD